MLSTEKPCGCTINAFCAKHAGQWKTELGIKDQRRATTRFHRNDFMSQEQVDRHGIPIPVDFSCFNKQAIGGKNNMRTQFLVLCANTDDVLDGRIRLVSSDKLRPGEIWIVDDELFDDQAQLPSHAVEHENVLNIAHPRAIRLYPQDKPKSQQEENHAEKSEQRPAETV